MDLVELHGSGGERGDRPCPVPGKQVVEKAHRMFGNAGENIGKPGLGIDVVEPRGLDEGVKDGGALTAAIRPAEQPDPARANQRLPSPLLIRALMPKLQPRRVRSRASSWTDQPMRPAFATG